ncbi:MAG: S8 family serine peptidase, partial [Acidobacteriota bacterium]|nr:S8 family serine peptidase [Acidobacteriota bacterium]
RLPAARAASVRSLAGVRFIGPLHPGLKIAPDLGTRPFADPARRATSRLTVTVELFDGGASPEEVAAGIEALGAAVLGVEPAPARRVRARASRQQVEAIARLADVKFIEELGEITYRNNTTRWVVQSNELDATPVWDRGLHGEGQIAGLLDNRLDMNSCFFRDDANNTPGPTHRKVVAYRSSSGQGADSHGTHTGGTIAGDQFPINATTTDNGIAYEAKLAFGNSNDVFGSGSAPSNLYDALRNAHLDGARAHSNSWGDDGTTAYTSWCVDADRFSHDFEESLVLFAETNTGTLRTPENAKNLVAVGASSNGSGADSFCSGGVGPTADGRRKPEIFAPGCSIVSARNANTCGLRTSTGTSMACPAVAGAALLARQYFVDGFYPSGAASAADTLVPSGALMKAVLLNATVDMTSFGGTPPNDGEGWGRLRLDDALYFSGDTRRLALLSDLRNANGLTTGEAIPFALTVNSAAEPLKITLVFTEPAGSLLAADPVVNDLDLVVEAPNGTYLGNDFDAAGVSVTGGPADRKNNVEQVVLSAPVAGTYTVRVSGAAVSQGTQGFALIATGDVDAADGPFLTRDADTIDDAAPTGNADGVLDPGETATLLVDLENVGTEAASAVSAILSSNRPDLVKITRDETSFSDIPEGGVGSSQPPHYALTLEPAAICGDVVRFTLASAASGFTGETSWDLDVGRRRDEFPGASAPLPKKGTVALTVDVVDAFTIEDVQLAIDLSHQNVGELIVELASPPGTIVRLHDASGAGSVDLVGTYGSGLIPDGPGVLGDFNGEASQGTWTLTVQDTTGSNIPKGTLNSWSLKLTATSAYACDPLTCGDTVPGSVGDAVTVEGLNGGDLRLSWPALAGASAYRVWRSDLPTFEGEILVGETAATELVLTGALHNVTTRFYRVRATNGCNWEGP